MYIWPFLKNAVLSERPDYVPVFQALNLGQSTAQVSLEPGLRKFFSDLHSFFDTDLKN